MSERELRRRCRRQLRQLDIEPPLRVDVLCTRLGEQRGRPIRLAAYPMPVPGPFGMWLATGAADYILYQAETTRVHQDHIILHEVAHILADHRGVGSDDSWRAEYPDLSPDMIRRALRRNSYDSAHERQAELVATIIMEWAAVLDHTTPYRSDDEALRRIEVAMNDRQGWL